MSHPPAVQWHRSDFGAPFQSRRGPVNRALRNGQVILRSIGVDADMIPAQRLPMVATRVRRIYVVNAYLNTFLIKAVMFPVARAIPVRPYHRPCNRNRRLIHRGAGGVILPDVPFRSGRSHPCPDSSGEPPAGDTKMLLPSVFIIVFTVVTPFGSDSTSLAAAACRIDGTHEESP